MGGIASGPGVPIDTDGVVDGELYLDTATMDVWIYNAGWVRVGDAEVQKEPSPVKELTEADEAFLRELLADTNRLPLYVRHGALQNDRGQTLLQLTPAEIPQGAPKWTAMKDKLRAMFCLICSARASNALCDECRTRLATELNELSEETRF